MYLVRFDGDDVHIHLAGTCAGCPGRESPATNPSSCASGRRPQGAVVLPRAYAYPRAPGRSSTEGLLLSSAGVDDDRRSSGVRIAHALAREVGNRRIEHKGIDGLVRTKRYEITQGNPVLQNDADQMLGRPIHRAQVGLRVLPSRFRSLEALGWLAARMRPATENSVFSLVTASWNVPPEARPPSAAPRRKP